MTTTCAQHSRPQATRHWAGFLILVVGFMLPAGCADEPPKGALRLDDVLQGRASPISDAAAVGASSASGDVVAANSSAFGSASAPEMIATVNGAGIARQRLVDLLIQAHGLPVIEQLILFELAKQASERAGLAIGPADYDREYQMALEGLMNAAGLEAETGADRGAGEQLLDEFLAAKNLSRAEYMLSVQRNAHLRKLAERDVPLGEEDLRREFDNVHGERVEIRHIQVNTLAEASQVRKLLDEGVPFEVVAKSHSHNQVTAEQGGLLPPFGPDDQSVPEVLRRVAFRSAVGEVSSAIPFGGQFHIIRVDRRIAPADVRFEDARDDLAKRLRDQTILANMQNLAKQLLDEARVTIADPKLQKGFDAKRPRSR